MPDPDNRSPQRSIFKCQTIINLPLGNHNFNENRLAKISAIDDTLKVTAINYTTKSEAITSYEQVVNITLVTAGAPVRRISGCGKATTLKRQFIH